MRRKNRGRNISGIVLLDKPLGLSSNKALQEVKNLFFARKAGHTGSLDPLASGLLALCFGEATKISNFLFDANKHYRATGKLGEITTTGDAEGEVIESRPVPELDVARLEAVLEQFKGEISQVPPMYSALKHKGEPLYKLARQGIEIEREPRQVTIYSLSLIELTADSFTIDIECSRGTYIRTLVEDIGKALGCGAYVTALRRTGLGPFDEADMVTLDTLKAVYEQDKTQLKQFLRPTSSALEDWPEVNLTEDMAFYMRQGQPVIVPHAPTEGWVRLNVGGERFLGMGQILDDGRVAPKRLLGEGA
ncbi:tRNA pseudouridine(55) synthase TruB [Sulfuriflexus mobilis]|uniref:tRNA pseudouridine(55) synthase TruB n=1 Tax=Sulfuriflexus mobilis TaxID=1811807 RepID=UPI000F829D2D|nr:tRNA pseudouridine(55) synthase TruB [Sulfuriflexus mobilis]